MPEFLDEACGFSAADVVGGVGGIGRANVLADLFEMQGLF